jgi:DNA-binding SARP family transcriptional activator
MLAVDPAVDDPIRVFLAGGVSILTPNGRVIGERAFAGRQGRRLFVRLATAPGPLAAEDIADDLWGDAWPGQWEVAVRALFSKLRATLRSAGLPDAIVARDGAYQVRLRPDAWLDLEAAPDAIHRAEHLLADGEVEQATGWALAARAIASRSLLPGEEADWLDTLRRRLIDIHLRALAALGEIWLRHGEPSVAARDAIAALAIDPYLESAHRLLIRAYLAAGEHAAALQAYRACREVFQAELGVLPSPETLALVQPWLVRGQG